MATIFFTNTNQIGDGSLYQTVLNAQEGDVVAPDPTVFGVGERVVIDFADILKIERPITIDAGKTRLILTKSQKSGSIPAYILIDTSYSTIAGLHARGVAFNGRVLPGGSLQKYRFDKCVFGGFPKGYNSVHPVGYCDIEFNDCAFICGYGSPFFGTSTRSSYIFNRCTIAANKANETSPGRIGATYVDCIDEPDLSTAGFANVPTNLDSVVVTKWEEYDFTPLPSSPYATGATSAENETDILGSRRGYLDSTGETQYAVGAYEVVNANYYLAPNVGSTASFTDPAIWRTERGGDATPEVVEAGVFFIDETVTLIGAPPEGASIVVAGPSRVEIGADCIFEEIRIGSRSEIEFKGTARGAALDLRDESLLELAPGTINTVDSLTNGSGVTLKSSSRSYFSAPVITPSLFENENVVVGVRGAGLTGFFAAAKNSNEVALSWTCKDSSVPIVLERRIDGEWTTALASALGLTATVPFGTDPVELIFDDWRAWDGDVFLTASPSNAKINFFKYWSGVDAAVSVSEWIVESLVVNEWITDTITMKAGEMGYRNENALFLALIKNPLSGALLQPEEVSGITATFYKVGGWSSPNVWTPVDGWVDIAVPSDSVLPAPIDVETLTQSGTTWSRDEGPNFSWTPNTTTSTPFSDNGSYVVQVKIVLKDGKNPIVATFNNKVY